MEGQVPRSCAGIQFGKGWIAGSERAFGAVEAIDEDFVEAEIGSEREAIVGRGFDPVGMGTFLAVFVDAGAGVLDESGGGSQAAVFADGECGDAATVIVCDEDKLAGLVERDMAGAGALRGGLAEKGEFAGFGID